jgi:hypothetical protein
MKVQRITIVVLQSDATQWVFWPIKFTVDPWIQTDAIPAVSESDTQFAPFLVILDTSFAPEITRVIANVGQVLMVCCGKFLFLI